MLAISVVIGVGSVSSPTCNDVNMIYRTAHCCQSDNKANPVTSLRSLSSSTGGLSDLQYDATASEVEKRALWLLGKPLASAEVASVVGAAGAFATPSVLDDLIVATNPAQYDLHHDLATGTQLGFGTRDDLRCSALVVGGTRGIGFAFALELASPPFNCDVQVLGRHEEHFYGHVHASQMSPAAYHTSNTVTHPQVYPWYLGKFDVASDITDKIAFTRADVRVRTGTGSVSAALAAIAVPRYDAVLLAAGILRSGDDPDFLDEPCNESQKNMWCTNVVGQARALKAVAPYVTNTTKISATASMIAFYLTKYAYGITKAVQRSYLLSQSAKSTQFPGLPPSPVLTNASLTVINPGQTTTPLMVQAIAGDITPHYDTESSAFVAPVAAGTPGAAIGLFSDSTIGQKDMPIIVSTATAMFGLPVYSPQHLANMILKTMRDGNEFVGLDAWPGAPTSSLSPYGAIPVDAPVNDMSLWAVSSIERQVGRKAAHLVAA